MKSLCALVLVGVCVAGCGGKDAPLAPAPVPSCQTNNTGTLTLGNRSLNNRTYTMALDGSDVVTLTPGETSNPLTVSANVTHTVIWRITNTNTAACNASFPSVPQCSNITLTCSF